MMGREDPPQPSLFYTSFNLDKRVRSNHPLRKVSKVIKLVNIEPQGRILPFYLFGLIS